jgi:hypothetical protein
MPAWRADIRGGRLSSSSGRRPRDIRAWDNSTENLIARRQSNDLIAPLVEQLIAIDQ